MVMGMRWSGGGVNLEVSVTKPRISNVKKMIMIANTYHRITVTTLQAMCMLRILPGVPRSTWAKVPCSGASPRI